jgi:HTH-type transcriptional regulator/antitoxin HigA
MQPKVIKNEDEYRVALGRIDELLDAEYGTPEGDELELWSILVEAYEDVHYPIAPPDPVDAIRFHMEQKNMRPVDLAPYLGGRSRVSEILNRKRGLSISQITTLWRELGIPLESLMPPAADDGRRMTVGRSPA